jgi:hypothetical protein
VNSQRSHLKTSLQTLGATEPRIKQGTILNFQPWKSRTVGRRSPAWPISLVLIHELSQEPEELDEDALLIIVPKPSD